jgi:hypothetical protein
MTKSLKKIRQFFLLHKVIFEMKEKEKKPLVHLLPLRDFPSRSPLRCGHKHVLILVPLIFFLSLFPPRGLFCGISAVDAKKRAQSHGKRGGKGETLTVAWGGERRRDRHKGGVSKYLQSGVQYDGDGDADARHRKTAHLSLGIGNQGSPSLGDDVY